MTNLYNTLPDAPEELDSNGVLARLVDGMGFRYHWATEGIQESLLSFRPCEGAMTLAELLAHMNVLVRWVDHELRRTLSDPPQEQDRGQLIPPTEWPLLRTDTLERLAGLRSLLAETSPKSLLGASITSRRKQGPQSFWCAINGPLADFLTHVGQVASWRRIANDPAPAADVFRGIPPN